MTKEQNKEQMENNTEINIQMIEKIDITKKNELQRGEVKNNSTLYITYLNVLACFAVVALHVNGVFWSFTKSGTWLSANFLECLFYFAVPIFFMCSGATLMNYRERYNTKQFFVKRVKKTVVPYLIWSCISLLLGYFLYKTITYELITDFRWIISGFLNGGIESVYWFFIPLFAFYLCIPLLSLISPNDEEKRKSVLKYIIIVGFIVNMCLPLLFNLLKINFSMNVFVVSGYVIYGLLGFYISKYNIEKRWRIVFYIVGILGFLIHFFGTWGLSYKIDMVDSTFKGYLNVPCFVYSMAIFLLFRNINFERLNKNFTKIVKWVASATFGIYLIHMNLLKLLNHFLITSSIWFRTIGVVVVFAVCVLIVKLIQLIPKVGKIILP